MRVCKLSSIKDVLTQKNMALTTCGGGLGNQIFAWRHYFLTTDHSGCTLLPHADERSHNLVVTKETKKVHQC